MNHRASRASRGFTLVEILVTVGVVLLLLGILLPALSAVVSGGRRVSSTNNLRQIAAFMTSYANDHREVVVPSEFNYQGAQYPGKVRSAEAIPVGERFRGTWADILWVENGFPAIPPMTAIVGHDYKTMAPDNAVYLNQPNFDQSPFRSTEQNSRDYRQGDGAPLPLGTGADAVGLPGYFAANQFFRVQPSPDPFGGGNVVFPSLTTYAQLTQPSNSLYLIDSVAGWTIDSNGPAWDPEDADFQIDFRYSDQCLILFLDGSVRSENEWTDLADLETKRQVRVQNLTGSP